MAYDSEGNWIPDDEDPYKYADYTMPSNGGTTEHTYDPETGQEHVYWDWGNGDPWAPTPSGHETADAYFLPGPPGTPPPPGGGGGGGGGGGTNINGGGGGGSAPPRFAGMAPFAFDFQYPDWVAPTAKAGDWTPPSWDVGEFSYPDYVAPTAETFQTDPGYDFRQKEMQRAIINDKSARGLRSTGGTLKELMSYAGGLASQEYGNVNNRQFQTWQANRGNALDAYRLKYGSESDEYQRALTDYNSRRSLDQDTFTNALTSYLTGYGRESDDFSRALQTHTTNYGEAANTFGINNNAQNDRWNQLLGLYNIATRSLPTYTLFNPGNFS
jgi:hypothetical protein